MHCLLITCPAGLLSGSSLVTMGRNDEAVDPSAKAKERCALPELTGKRLPHVRRPWLTLRQCRTKMGRMNSRALGLPRFDIGKHTVQLRCLTRLGGSAVVVLRCLAAGILFWEKPNGSLLKARFW